MFIETISVIGHNNSDLCHKNYDHIVIIIMTYSHKYYNLKVNKYHKVSNYFFSNFLTIFFFTYITNVNVFVKYNSHWDENNIFIDNESIGILVFMSMSYDDLLEILFEALKLNLEILDLRS